MKIHINRLLKTLKMQLHESEQNMFESLLYQIKDSCLELPLLPMSEEVEMLKKSFNGGVSKTLLRASIELNASDQLSFVNNDVPNTSLFDLVVDEQRSTVVQLPRKSKLSCEGDRKISVPADYNKKLVRSGSKKSTVRKSAGASFDAQSKLRDSKVVRKSGESKVRRQPTTKVDRTEPVRTKEQSLKSSVEEITRASLTSEEDNLSKSSSSKSEDYSFSEVEVEKQQEKSKKANKKAKPNNKTATVNKPKAKLLKLANKK